MKEKAVQFSFHYLSKPISPVAARAIILDQINQEWARTFVPAVLQEYKVVSGYDKWKNRPTFLIGVVERATTYELFFEVTRNQAGKIFVWTDLGTGIEGPSKKKYKIIMKPYAPKKKPSHPPTKRARKRSRGKGKRTAPQASKKIERGEMRKITPVNAATLFFTVPYKPKTMPMGGVRYNTGATPKKIFTKSVDHPGTRPRYFSQKVISRLIRNFQGPNTFYQATMRGFNRGIAIARARGVIP